MHSNEGFEFRIGGFALRGVVGGAVSVTAQSGTQLTADQALALARVLQAVASPAPAPAQLDAAALVVLERLTGGSSAVMVATAPGLSGQAALVAPAARVTGDSGATAVPAAGSAKAQIPALEAAPAINVAETKVGTEVIAAPAPASRPVLAFHRNIVPRSVQEAALAWAAVHAPAQDAAARADKRLLLPAREGAAAPAAPARVSRRLREPAQPLAGRRAGEPQPRRLVARDAAHADQLLVDHKATKPDKRLVYPIGPVEAAALIPTAAKATGKRLVRPSAARVEIARPPRVDLSAPPAAAAVPSAQSGAPKVAAPEPVASLASSPRPQASPQFAAPGRTIAGPSVPATAVRMTVAAPTALDSPNRPKPAVASGGAKPAPVLRSSAPPAKPKGGIMDRYDEWMRENPGQHARDHLVDVGVRLGWLPKDDAHRVFNVAMHQQRAREMFMILRDGGNETFMRREEATRPTSTGPGKIIRRPAAEVAARRQEAP